MPMKRENMSGQYYQVLRFSGSQALGFSGSRGHRPTQLGARRVRKWPAVSTANPDDVVTNVTGIETLVVHRYSSGAIGCTGLRKPIARRGFFGGVINSR